MNTSYNLKLKIVVSSCIIKVKSGSYSGQCPNLGSILRKPVRSLISHVLKTLPMLNLGPI